MQGMQIHDRGSFYFSRYVEKIVVPVRICDPGDRHGRCLSFCGYDGGLKSEHPRIYAQLRKMGSPELEYLSGFAGHRFFVVAEKR
jgi:hypothetical protein